MKIGNFNITENGLPYIIAEIGVNHEGSMDKAKELIELAKEGGAHAAKFQTYKASTLASKNSPAYWDLQSEPTTSQFELFKKYDSFGISEYQQLADHCKKVGIDFLSTPFDLESVEFLSEQMNCFKIASADITTLPLLRAIARKNKPVVLSTGAANLDEIETALTTLKEEGVKEICLLHCILNYPTPPENAHLNMIKGLKKAFPDVLIGYSDHVAPDPAMAVLTAAYLNGARIIEKHFTHDKTLPGNDHYHAMDCEDLKVFNINMTLLNSALGETDKRALDSEELSRKNARRSIVINRDIEADRPLEEQDLIFKRPGTGISPLHWDEVLGKITAKNLAEDHILNWSDLRS